MCEYSFPDSIRLWREDERRSEGCEPIPKSRDDLGIITFPIDSSCRLVVVVNKEPEGQNPTYQTLSQLSRLSNFVGGNVARVRVRGEGFEFGRKKMPRSFQRPHRVPDEGGGAGHEARGGALRARAEQEVRLPEAADGAGAGAPRAAAAARAADPGGRRVRGRRPRRPRGAAAEDAERGGRGGRCR